MKDIRGKKFGLISIILLFLLVAGCSRGPRAMRIEEDGRGQATRLKVYASFYPYYDFAKNIGGDSIDLYTIIPSGTEPHSFEPSSRLIAQLEGAHVFIYNGAQMEPWLDKLLNILEEKDIYLVDASRSVDLIAYSRHEEEAGHGHGDYDPHIWVDPINAIKISESIKEAFIRADSENRTIYEENFNKFKGKLEDLDRAFRSGLEGATRRKIIVSHSAFAYLARRYDLDQIPVAGISPHAEPSPKRLAQLTEIARDNEIDYIFLEALASVKTAEILAREADLQILTLHIVEGLTEEEEKRGEDYISLMYKNIQALKKALVM